MRIKIYVSFLAMLMFAILVHAQDFTSLDWKNNGKNSLPDFEGSVRYDGSKLPNYATNFYLGMDYRSFDYEVRVEYPEFEVLKKAEIDSLINSGEKLELFPEVKTYLGVSAKEGILEAHFIPLVFKDGMYMKIKSFKLTLNRKQSKKRSFAPPAGDRYAENSVLSTGKWVKIRLTDAGVYRLTDAELTRMGFTTPAKVRLYGYGGRLLPEVIGAPEVDDLQEIPLWREKGYSLFYANGTVSWKKNNNFPVIYKHTQNTFSNYSYYFLTESESAPKEFPRTNSLSENGAVTTTYFPDYTLYEKDGYSWMPAGRQFFEEYDYKINSSKSYTLSAPGILNDSTAYLDVSFSAYSTASSTSLSVNLNGASMGQIPIAVVTNQYEVARVVEQRFNWNDSKNEKVVVALTHNRPSSVSGRLDFIRLNYKRRLEFTGSYLNFRGAAGKLKFILSGANADISIWDISDVNNYKQINGTLNGSNYTFVVDNSAGGEYVAVNTKGTFGKVEVVGNVSSQNLHALKNLDMVIIVPPNAGLISQAERLAEAHRDKDDLKVQVVTSEQVYNEFSSGTPDATAYRRLMKMLYDRAVTKEEMPKYLLLFGDGVWDNRMVTAALKNYNQADFLLCYESENSISHTGSYVLEDYFGYLDDGEGGNFNLDKLDIGIGRFPVRTSEQARQMVDKTIDYIYNKYAGSWKNMTCIMADDEEGTSVHMQDGSKMAAAIERNNPELLVKKVYWDAYERQTSASGNSYPGAKQDIFEQIKNGALLMAYAGHANPLGLSHEGVLGIKDVENMNSPRLPFWLTMGCDVGPFDNNEVSFGKQLFLNPNGGAIGTLTSTRTTYSISNGNMGAAFIKFALKKGADGKALRLGDAIREARCALISGTGANGDFGTDTGINKLQYVLLGDPAVTLNTYNREIVIDQFNGKDLTEETTLKAGGKVTVEGRVLDPEGNTDVTFNGVIYPTVLDYLENLQTKGHDGNDPFKYTARTKKLFAGADSIRAGKFNFTFPVPMDISYSFESGLLNFYALDNTKDKEAKGLFDNFLVGGTEDGAMNTDSLGPKIFLYLNTPDFPYGGEVNATPMLVAQLKDEDGINMVGNGIGHDLVTIIDNSPLQTYVLNSYYTPDFGSYTSGTVRYALPKLSEGKHKLLFRAWDVKNNSSTSELEFNVNYNLKPEFDVTCLSPAKDQTTFIITHDRPESELEFDVAVYDFSGREVWLHTEKGISTGNVYNIDWDLTSNGGQRLQPGIYLFRASVASSGSKQTTKSRKIVILAQ